MNKTLIFSIVVLLSFLPITRSIAQGVSVSYLIPKNGLISAPVSPFSVRGIRLPFSSYMGLQAGGTLYIFPGLPMDGLPFKTETSLRGPSFGVITPVEIYAAFGSSNLKIIVSTGVFGMGLLTKRLDQGAWDRSFASYQEWEIANGQLSLDNKPGWGWLAGISFEVPINRQYAISIGINYLKGKSDSPVSGGFTGYSALGGLLTQSVSFPDANTALEGLELSFGISF
jgi:hypothetical protein